MCESELYSRLLLPKKHGYPLFRPQPSDDLPEPVRRIGTEIGDVGIITEDGCFDPIFNILARDNPVNRFGVPEGFQPVQLNPGDIRSRLEYHLPGSDVSNTTVSKKRLGVQAGVENNVFLPAGAGAVVEVSTNSKRMGLLLLPDGASRWDLRPLPVFRDYALEHAQNWFAFINGKLRYGVGDLYLVTGVTKSTSWSVAALENQSGDGNVSLKLKAAQFANVGVSRAWEWESASSSVDSGPRHHLGEELWRDNQTVFLRGYKVALRSTPLRRSPKVLLIANSAWKDILSRSAPGLSSHSQPSSGSSLGTQPSESQTPPSSGDRPSDGGEMPDGDSPSDGREAPGSNSSSDDGEPVDRLVHPSDGINEILLASISNANVAVTHDDEWASVLTDADEEVPETSELVKRISDNFDIQFSSKGVYLQARNPDESLAAPSNLQAAQPMGVTLLPTTETPDDHINPILRVGDDFPAGSVDTRHLEEAAREGSQLYKRLLLDQGHGYPLFHPQPYDDLPEAARRNGTQIGDVGVMTEDGGFEPIFNIIRTGNDPANRFGVPRGFQPVALRLEDISTNTLSFRPGSEVSNAAIKKQRLDGDIGIESNVFAPAEPGTVVEVSMNLKEAAILLLPDGASSWDLRQLTVFRDYAAKHAHSWYEFVNGHLGRMIGTGDLYLVTGVTKSSSWSIAVVNNQSEKVSLKLKAKPSLNTASSYAWEWENAGPWLTSGPRRFEGEESWRDNQTLFLRGFKVSVRSTPLMQSSKALSTITFNLPEMMSQTTLCH